MTYTHLTMNEVTMIHLYWDRNTRVSVVVNALRRSKQTIYKVYHYFDSGKSPLDYCHQYHLNTRCASWNGTIKVHKKPGRLTLLSILNKEVGSIK